MSTNRGRVLALVAVLGALVALACGLYVHDATPSAGASDDAQADVRVLFIGNSFTAVNAMPEILRSLAADRHTKLAFTMHAPGGATLAQHAASSEVRTLLGKHWDYVVLQDQSQHPAYPELRAESEAGLLSLAKVARDGGAKIFLFATWGYRDGDPTNVDGGHDSYDAMQARLDEGYTEMSRRAGVELVPVARAWSIMRREHPGIGLWGPDGKHPSLAGSYLAACVFYAALLRRSPIGIKFTSGLSLAEVNLLQDVAARAAL
jgi:hypothetical protein